MSEWSGPCPTRQQAKLATRQLKAPYGAVTIRRWFGAAEQSPAGRSQAVDHATARPPTSEPSDSGGMHARQDPRWRYVERDPAYASLGKGFPAELNLMAGTIAAKRDLKEVPRGV